MKKRLLAFIMVLCMMMASVPAWAADDIAEQPSEPGITDPIENPVEDPAPEPVSNPIINLNSSTGVYAGKTMTMKATVSGLNESLTGVTAVWTVNNKTVQTDSLATVANGTVLTLSYTLPASTAKASNAVTVSLKQGATVLASASTSVPTLFGFAGATLTASGKAGVTVSKSTTISAKLTGLKADVQGTYQWYVDGKAVGSAKGTKTFTNKQTLKYSYKPTKTGTHTIKLVIKSADGQSALTSSTHTIKVYAKYAKTLGSYTTYFTLSNQNRCTNMRLVVKAINGKVIQPGQTFSLNSATGKRNAARGYKQSIVFRGTQQVYGYGGGTCQVVSTLFNAALLSNMTITERHNHTLPVTYIPKGRDAAVNSGSKDFRFKNNLGVPVKIVATYNPRGSMTIKFKADYGTAYTAPKLKVTYTSGQYRYVLRRYLNGKLNYTTKSKN
jgi:vancomycin resistance protein YoaR